MKTYVKIIFFILMAFSIGAYAGWVGPSQVLSGNWGTQPQEFYVDWGDVPAYAIYPGISDIADDGLIAIGDEEYFKFYASTGEWVRNISLPYGSLHFVTDNMVLQGKTYQFLSRSGDVLKQIASPTRNIPGKAIYSGEREGKLYVAVGPPNKQWLIYSSTGELLNTVTEKPHELGRIADEIFLYSGNKLHRVTVSFPAYEWRVVSRYGSCGEYNYRTDSDGNLYCIGEQGVTRYSICGKDVARFSLPDDVMTQKDSGDPGVENHYTVIEAYRGLKMTGNRDLYASKITQDNYSVIKWTWQNSPNDPVGSPDAPVELTAALNAGAVDLHWIPSLQDPGCVTEYEVGRSTVAGGPYTPVTTVSGIGNDQPYTYTDSTAQSGTTYYYAIRAVSAIANSPYSNEASVQVP